MVSRSRVKKWTIIRKVNGRGWGFRAMQELSCSGMVIFFHSLAFFSTVNVRIIILEKFLFCFYLTLSQNFYSNNHCEGYGVRATITRHILSVNVEIILKSLLKSRQQQAQYGKNCFFLNSSGDGFTQAKLKKFLMHEKM